MIPPSPFSFAVVLLAAGASLRMEQPKLLLPWHGTTVVGHLIQLWTRLGAAQVGVVCAPTDTALIAELDRLHFPNEDRIINPEPARGMFSSIQCAALWKSWKTEPRHWGIVLGDQPHLGFESLSRLIAFATKHPEKIAQPGRNGRPRHPVILPEQQFRALGASPFGNLKQFLQTNGDQVALIEMDDPGFDLDLDYPSDVAAAARLRSR